MATASVLVSRKQLDSRFGPRTVALFLDDDGDEQSESSNEEDVLQAGSDCTYGHLLPGFTEAQILKLVDNDAHMRGMVLDICADEMGRRRPAHIDKDGNSPYTKIRENAEKKLAKIGAAAARAKGETQSANNALLRTRTNLDAVSDPLIFTRTTGRPTGQGGF